MRFGNLLSVGRVQTPTLAILVRRQEEIDNFVAQDYWEIRADYPDFSGLWYDRKKKESRTYDLAKAQEIALKVEGKAVLSSISGKKQNGNCLLNSTI